MLCHVRVILCHTVSYCVILCHIVSYCVIVLYCVYQALSTRITVSPIHCGHDKGRKNSGESQACPSCHFLPTHLSPCPPSSPSSFSQNGLSFTFLPSPFKHLNRCQSLDLDLPSYTPTSSHSPHNLTEDHLAERWRHEL